MEKLFDRHREYMALVPMDYIRSFADNIDWQARLTVIKGPKGVGKSTLMQQYIKSHYSDGDQHVLYCSADMSYFSNHTLTEVADKFIKQGGTHLFIDEIHKYSGWSAEIKEIYDLYRGLRVVLSGSSLLQINDGDVDLSRRMVCYNMPGLSFREFLRLDQGIQTDPVGLEDILNNSAESCSAIRKKCRPLEFFGRYLERGYYPFCFEAGKNYHGLVEAVVNYTVDSELTRYRGLDIGNSNKLKALLQVISEMVPYDVDISKLSRSIGIMRPTTLKYLKHLEESCLIRRVFEDLKRITDLQKPDKIYLDNTNLMYVLCQDRPDTGTMRETFVANQLAAAGHRVEYAGYKNGDFRVDGKYIIEIGGADKGYGQIGSQPNSFIAADDIDTAYGRKIPLWMLGFLY